MIKTKGTELAKLEAEVFGLPERMKKIRVVDKESLNLAHQEKIYIKKVRKQIADFCDPNINRLHVAHKEAVAQKRAFEHPLIEAENYIDPQIASYLAKLEQIRRAAEEKVRREREEAARKAKEEEDARLEAALKAEEKGNEEEAEAILDHYDPIQEPPTQQTFVPPKEKLRGLSVRKTWKWEPEDPLGFEGIPREWMILVPHKEKIDAYVREMKERAKIKGIKIFSKDAVSQRLG